MLIHVQPDKVSEYWDFFAGVFEQSLPPIVLSSDRGISALLQAILLEVVQVWVYENKEKGVMYIATTVPYIDPVFGTRSLMIYTFTSVRELSKTVMLDSYETLKKFAKANDFDNIIAFTENKGIIKIVNSLGGITKNTVVELPV